MDPKYLKLEDLLGGKLFRIPEYQRTYSWQKRQRRDLFDDIQKLAKTGDPDRKHFMATIACLGRKPVTRIAGAEYEKLDVVDGQQRLTSLIILLKSIALRLRVLGRDGGEDSQEITTPAADIERLLVKPGREREVLLQANHDRSELFRDFLQDGTVPPLGKLETAADQNLRSACIESSQFVEEFDKGDVRRTLELAGLVRYRLSFVFYELEDEATVYRVFEALNSRGLPVDSLDKCKSVLLGIAAEKEGGGADPDPISEILKTWCEIYRLLGLDDVNGEEALRFAATLWKKDEASRPLSASESIEVFRNGGLDGGVPALQKESQLIADVVRELRGFLGRPDMAAVAEISHARLLAVAIRLSALSEEQKASALDQWERMTFRIFGLYRKDARTRVGDYVRAACKIYQGCPFPHVMATLRNIALEFPASGVESELRAKNCYTGWEKELRYFMYRYEEALSKGSVSTALWKAIWAQSPDRTIEHVLPQDPSKGWPPYDPSTLRILANRLGNLVVLSQVANSSASNDTFQEKKATYVKEGSAGLRHVAALLDHSVWGPEEVEAREKVLIDWATTRWADVPSQANVRI